LRLIERNVCGVRVVHDNEYGVWIVDIDHERCVGTVWLGHENGGYGQCSAEPAFGDNRCFDHTDYENPEMVAFQRELAYMVGMPEPNAFLVSQLHISEVEELFERLTVIVPSTRKDNLNKNRIAGMLKAAIALLKWKELMRRRRESESWMHHEAWERHRRSSINPFEYTLKKYFLILEVEPDATREETLRAWKRLARRYHPDTENGDEEQMKRINMAKDSIFRIRRWD
jgi:hypothetical protein